jgi:hypothetical protein
MGGGSGGQDFTIGITNLAVLYSTQWVYKWFQLQVSISLMFTQHLEKIQNSHRWDAGTNHISHMDSL